MSRPSPMRDKELMIRACSAKSINAAMKIIGLHATGGNYKSFYKWCEIHGLTPPVVNKVEQTQSAREKNVLSHEELFVKNGNKNHRGMIKGRLRNIFAEWKCFECGLPEEWNGKPLVLQLDHINGINNDHRLENLRLLCPNCHSQTETFARKART